MEGGLRSGEGGLFDVKMKDRGCRYFGCRDKSEVRFRGSDWSTNINHVFPLDKTAYLLIPTLV